MEKLVNRLDEYDAVMPNHYQTDLPSRAIMPAILDACRAILDEGKEDLVEMYRTGQGTLVERHYKFIKGFSMIGYQPNEDGLRRPAGTPWPAPEA